ncbi:hypothetical protein GQ457_14G022470 [Hibiscus cannabinus]
MEKGIFEITPEAASADAAARLASMGKATLALFAATRTSGIVVNIGFQVTSVVPIGSGLTPFDCWICLRGIKTMALRVEKQQEIAEFLSSLPSMGEESICLDLHYSQAKRVLDPCLVFRQALSKHVVEMTKYFNLTVSFGSVKSLVSLPCFMSHASIPSVVHDARGLSEDLVRISVGIDDVNDLIAYLDDALRTGPL